MADERQIREAIARCLSAMAHYHGNRRSPAVHERMVAEVRVVAGFVEELGLGAVEVAERIIQPVEDELIARYDHMPGSRLAIQFVDAFDGLGIPNG